MQKYFKTTGTKELILEWKSKGLSDEVIKSAITSNHRLTPELIHCGTKTRVLFYGTCLKQDKITYAHGSIVNIYIVYELSSNLNNFDPALESCLFGTVKLTKNADIDKYKYSIYGIGFDASGSFLFPNGSFGQNIIIFGVDMSSSAHTNNKKKIF